MSGILTVLVKAIAFVMIIVTGYLLKKKGFFQPKDFYLISKIVINITLPCAIITNLSSVDLDYSFLLMCLLAIAANLILIFMGYLINIHSTKEWKSFGMINLSGYNIGNFTLPFVQSFLGPAGFAATSLFDAGNAVMCMGLTYTMASAVKGTGEKFSLKSVLQKLVSSIPFDVYIIMTILAICRIRLPQIVLSYASTVGNANAFLALFMIGLGFELYFEKEKMSQILRLLMVRYGVALAFAMCAYFVLPFSQEVRQALVLVAFGPISSVSPAFTGRLKGDVGLSSAVNSFSIIISIVAITAALVVML